MVLCCDVRLKLLTTVLCSRGARLASQLPLWCARGRQHVAMHDSREVLGLAEGAVEHSLECFLYSGMPA